MALLTTIQPMKAAGVLGGIDIPHFSLWEEAASQTYLGGAVMIFSSGTVEQASTHPTSGIIGIAENAGADLSSAGYYNGSTTTNGIVVPFVGSPVQGPMIALAHESVIFEANLAATSSSDPATSHTIALTDIGTKYAVAIGNTSSLWYVDYSDTTDTAVIIIGLKDAVGTAGGRVYFVFLNSKTIYN